MHPEFFRELLSKVTHSETKREEAMIVHVKAFNRKRHRSGNALGLEYRCRPHHAARPGFKQPHEASRIALEEHVIHILYRTDGFEPYAQAERKHVARETTSVTCPRSVRWRRAAGERERVER